MMSKKLLLAAIIISLLFPFKIIAASSHKSLIVYETLNDFGHSENRVNHLTQLLYAFNPEVQQLNIHDYTSELMFQYDSIFIMNLVTDITNQEFLSDLTAYSNKIFWIGDKIENFLEYSSKYSFHFIGKSNNITKLNYREDEYLIRENAYYNVIQTGLNSSILATMSDGYNTYPYILSEDNLTYISRYAIGEHYIFEDSLYDFYGQSEFESSQIFIRIEDVHPFRDTEQLRKVTDYLAQRDIPFIVALIPTYVDTKTGHINTLNDVPEFVETIKYMQSNGGSIILHGYTHQLGIDEVSGEGYEFWDIKNDQAIDNIEQYIEENVLLALRLCVENGIYPLAFEAPHYAIDSTGYKTIKQYFSTYIGHYQNNDQNFATSTFPYRINNSNLFNKLIPENLGYLEEDDLFTVDVLIEQFEKLSKVRGYTGGFFYHPYIEFDLFTEVIDYFIDQDVKFLDLKKEENEVIMEDVIIKSKNGLISATFDLDKAITQPENQSIPSPIFKNINDVIILFVSIVLFIFSIIYFVFRKINKNKYLR